MLLLVNAVVLVYNMEWYRSHGVQDTKMSEHAMYLSSPDSSSFSHQTLRAQPYYTRKSPSTHPQATAPANAPHL